MRSELIKRVEEKTKKAWAKLAWESMDYAREGDKVVEVYRGSRPGTMTAAKAQGLEPVFDKDLGGTYKASREVTDPKKKREILAKLIEESAASKKKYRGLLGGKPLFGHRRKMYEMNSAELDKRKALSEKLKSAAAKRDPRLERAGVSGFNKPKRTPGHPTKSHIVVAKEGDRVKTIRFGQQGVKTNQTAGQRKAFKSRHAKNISKGRMSAAYWADKAKWSPSKTKDKKNQKWVKGS